MSRTKRRKSSPRIAFRIDEALAAALAERVKERNLPSPSAYLRGLVERDLSRRPDDDRIGRIENMMAANNAQVTGLLRSIAVMERATHALLDVSMNAVLSYLPDEGPDSLALVRARGKRRHDKVHELVEKVALKMLDKLLAEAQRGSIEAAKA